MNSLEKYKLAAKELSERGIYGYDLEESDDMTLSDGTVINSKDFHNHRYYSEDYWYYQFDKSDEYYIINNGTYDSWNGTEYDSDFIVCKKKPVQDFYFEKVK